MASTTNKESLGFQAEVKQLLHLMIHSLYSNKEIFLRELISNASDAADKLRFEALSDNSLYGADGELKIRVSFDKSARTLTVSDNGIGMSREEAIANLGTIAKSGTREFFQSLTGDQAKDARLIGQFGVGFYSSFIAADKVTVVTRRAGLPADQAVRWECEMREGAGEYTVEAVEKESRGTEVTLHLREGEDDLLSDLRLKTIIRKYSDHIALPIVMKKYQWDENKQEQIETAEEETVNQASALWARPRSEITEEQYHEFYKHVGHDFEPPLAYTHNRVEGRQEYTQLLYIPARAPFDLWDREHRRGLKLYVRRVFIMDDAEQLMPAYLRFVRGVVDSADLPLNVSREILQQSKDIDAIRSGCTRRVLQLLEEMADIGRQGGKEGDDKPAGDDRPEAGGEKPEAGGEKPEERADVEKAGEQKAGGGKDRYATFWKEFGRVLKEGMGEDHANRDRIARLLRFSSTHEDSEEQGVSLADYVARMKPGQEAIYYVTAETFLAARNSPHLELLRKRGIEALLLYDRVDEWVVANLPEFDGKPLVSAAKGELDLGTLEDEGEKKVQMEKAGEFRELAGKLKAALGDKVKDVRVSHRLTESPSCLVADEHEMGGNLARILQAAGQKVPAGKPILEINPLHPLVERLKGDQGAGRFDDWSNLLFEQALLAEGGTLEDPAGFVRRTNALLLEMTGGASKIWTPG